MHLINGNIMVGQTNSKPKPVEKSHNSLKPDNLNSFANILSNKINEENKVQFSKHAEMRLSMRSINLTNEQMNRIEEGVNLAKEKGIKDSLVLIDNLALVVNTSNKIVITAMAKENEKENVFTKIDGAVIV